MILQACKYMERNELVVGSKALFEPVSIRWTTIEEDVCKCGVTRSVQQCKDKWEQVQADFKKVYDLEKEIPLDYYQMEST